jgi:predicted RNA-binding Zn ribbon-like protein
MAGSSPGQPKELVTDSLQTPDRAIVIATDLVNSSARGVETLRSPDDLRRFLLDHAEPEPVTVTARDLEQAREVRQRLRAVYAAERDRDAAAVINDLLEAHATRPYLSDHDGAPWHVHVTTMDAGWSRWLAATTAMGLAVLVAGYGFDALRICAARDCDRAFVVTSRQRVRRYCSPTCATRARGSSHRARRRAS